MPCRRLPVALALLLIPASGSTQHGPAGAAGGSSGDSSRATASAGPAGSTPPPTATICGANLGSPFHLRPHPTLRNAGPTVPAGDVGVLGIVRLRRERHGDPRTDAVLALVRVAATGATGYAFVRPQEFNAACPLLVEREASCASAPCPELDRHLYTRPGRFRNPYAALAGRPSATRIIARADFDRNGEEDQLIFASFPVPRHPVETIAFVGEYFVSLHFGTRWASLDVGDKIDHDHFDADFARLARAAGDVFAVFESGGVGGLSHAGCGDPDWEADDGHAETTLVRIDDESHAHEVFQFDDRILAEHVELVDGRTDGTVLLRGESSARTQVVRWVAQRAIYVADGNVFPLVRVAPMCFSQ